MNYYMQHRAGVTGLIKLLDLEPQEKSYLAFVQKTIFYNRNMLGEAGKIIKTERDKWASDGIAYNIQDILYDLFTKYSFYLNGFRETQHSFNNFSLEAKVGMYRGRIKAERIAFRAFREEYNMETILAEYEYEGQYIGEWVQINDLGDKELRTDINFAETERILWDMPVADKVRLKQKAIGVLKLAEYHRLNPDEYIDDGELLTYAVDQGYRNLTELNRGDHKVWELVRKRGLISKLFPELSPANLPLPSED